MKLKIISFIGLITTSLLNISTVNAKSITQKKSNKASISSTLSEFNLEDVNLEIYKDNEKNRENNGPRADRDGLD